MKFLTLLIPSVILGSAVACDPPKAAPVARTVKTTLPRANLASVSALASQWIAMHERVLVENSRALVASYQKLKANPPRQAAGTPRTIKPTDPIVAMNVQKRFLPKAIHIFARSPAVTSFDRLMHGRASAMVGTIDPDQARVVVNIADAGLVGYWRLFPIQTGKFGGRNGFADYVGEDLVEGTVELASAYSEAVANKGITSGTKGKWTYETWPLKFKDKSCFTCHAGKKPDDIAAIMLYAFAKKPAP